MPSHSDRTGSFASGPPDAVLEIALAWAGPARRAVLLSGSHATTEAVWIAWEGRRVSLSDVDLYVVLADESSCRAARARARDARPTLAARLLDAGLAAPLEAAFLTAEGLTRLCARPGTLELRRHGRVLEGEPSWLDRVPDHAPGDVTSEEITLLLENRGFELLAAHASLGRSPLDRWRARHATLKVALDLASVAALERGAWPDGAAARVEWARTHAARDGSATALWDAALAWRREPTLLASRSEAHDEWKRVVRAWCVAWRRRARAIAGSATLDDFALSLASASRSRFRSRVRQAIAFDTRGALGPSAWNRWRFAPAGTPQHRLNASAAILLLAALEPGTPVDPRDAPFPREAALAPRANAALARLGVIPAGGAAGWSAAAAMAVRAWDRWILDGQRSEEAR
ncbi:MAG: hypothetical protein HYR73_04055 [Candidatus Eisenbacteria bacterium]|nr:hypothetical protein [Candidatus Eisenbacteria bacterium]